MNYKIIIVYLIIFTSGIVIGYNCREPDKDIQYQKIYVTDKNKDNISSENSIMPKVVLLNDNPKKSEPKQSVVTQVPVTWYAPITVQKKSLESDKPNLVRDNLQKTKYWQLGVFVSPLHLTNFGHYSPQISYRLSKDMNLTFQSDLLFTNILIGPTISLERFGSHLSLGLLMPVQKSTSYKEYTLQVSYLLFGPVSVAVQSDILFKRPMAGILISF